MLEESTHRGVQPEPEGVKDMLDVSSNPAPTPEPATPPAPQPAPVAAPPTPAPQPTETILDVNQADDVVLSEPEVPPSAADLAAVEQPAAEPIAPKNPAVEELNQDVQEEEQGTAAAPVAQILEMHVTKEAPAEQPAEAPVPPAAPQEQQKEPEQEEKEKPSLARSFLNKVQLLRKKEKKEDTPPVEATKPETQAAQESPAPTGPSNLEQLKAAALARQKATPSALGAKPSGAPIQPPTPPKPLAPSMDDLLKKATTDQPSTPTPKLPQKPVAPAPSPTPEPAPQIAANPAPNEPVAQVPAEGRIPLEQKMASSVSAGTPPTPQVPPQPAPTQPVVTPQPQATVPPVVQSEGVVPPAPAAQQTPTPAPVAAPVQPPTATPTVAPKGAGAAPKVLRSMRTYRGDVEQVVSRKNTSIVGVIAAEQNRKAEEDKEREANAPKQAGGSSSAYLKVGVSGLLVGVGITALAFIMTLIDRTPENVPVASIPEYIFTEQQQQVDLTSLARRDVMSQLVQTRDTIDLELGTVANLYLTTTTQFPDGGTKAELIKTADFFRQIDAKAPDTLVRSLSEFMMYGVHFFDGAQPFFIFKTGFYENAFASMLGWEKDMNADLAPLFGPLVLQRSVDTGTSTGPTTDDFFGNSFTDEIVRNKEVRVLKDENDKIILLYSFPDPSTLIITTNEHTFAEIVTRMNSRRF